MTYPFRLMLMGLFLLGTIALPGGADEIDELVKKLNPPKRFADHAPRWSVEKKQFTFRHVKGEQSWDFYLIKDADRYVAIIPRQGFHGGTIYVQDFRPGHAPEQLDMPTERWHIDTARGTELQTTAFIPGSESAKEETYDFKIDEAAGTLTMTRKYKGEAVYNRWAHRDQKPQQVDVHSTFVFKVDPVHGYIVDGTYDIKAERIPPKYQFTSHATSGRYALWPGEATCYRTVVTPPNKEGEPRREFLGYYLNLAAIANGHLACRDGGFGGYLNDKTGWSTVTTTAKADSKIVVCNAHADLDFVSFTQRTDIEGSPMKQHIQKHRLLALPPELTKYVWEQMEVKFTDRSKVQIRIGDKETFEDQPLPLTTRVRGLTFTGNAPEIVKGKAKSGDRSMKVEGGAWPNIPQLVLKPNVRYRIEAWVLVEPWDEARLAKSEEKRKANLEKANKRNAKKGKPLIEDKGPTPPAAFITGHLYEWTPHSRQWLVKQSTNEAAPKPGAWQKIELEFESPAYGPFINIVFESKNCTTYFDDFRIYEIKGDPDMAMR